jgi:hypothetical protein
VSKRTFLSHSKNEMSTRRNGWPRDQQIHQPRLAPPQIGAGRPFPIFVKSSLSKKRPRISHLFLNTWLANFQLKLSQILLFSSAITNKCKTRPDSPTRARLLSLIELTVLPFLFRFSPNSQRLASRMRFH